MTLFVPSKLLGVGREYENNAFLYKLSSIRGYIVCDVVNFPTVNVYEVFDDNPVI